VYLTSKYYSNYFFIDSAFLQYNSINEEDPSAQALIHEEFPQWFQNYVSGGVQMCFKRT